MERWWRARWSAVFDGSIDISSHWQLALFNFRCASSIWRWSGRSPLFRGIDVGEFNCKVYGSILASCFHYKRRHCSQTLIFEELRGVLEPQRKASPLSIARWNGRIAPEDGFKSSYFLTTDLEGKASTKWSALHHQSHLWVSQDENQQTNHHKSFNSPILFGLWVWRHCLCRRVWAISSAVDALG